MDNKIGAQQNGLLQHGRQESVVYRHACPGCLGAEAQRFYIHNTHQRIAWGLDP